MIINSRRARPDAYTKLLIHPQGANLSTVFRDSSQSGHIITANGDVNISTAYGYFSDRSIYFDGTGDYLTVPDSDDWTWGASNTVDLRVWPSSNATLNNEYTLFSHGADGNHGWRLSWFGSGSGNSRKVQIHWNQEIGLIASGITSNQLTLDAWNHVAVVKNGATNVSVYLNGTSGLSSTIDKEMDNFTGLMHIGQIAFSLGVQPHYGYMDEIRISNGIARWTSNFTPPTRRY